MCCQFHFSSALFEGSTGIQKIKGSWKEMPILFQKLRCCHLMIIKKHKNKRTHTLMQKKQKKGQWFFLIYLKAVWENEVKAYMQRDCFMEWDGCPIKSTPLSIICTVMCKSTVCWGLSYATFLTSIFGSGCSVNKNYRKNKTQTHHNCVHYLTKGPWDTQAGPTNCIHQQTNKQTNLTLCGKIPIKTETPHPKRVQKGRCKAVSRDRLKVASMRQNCPSNASDVGKWNIVVANNWDNQNYW